MRSEGNGCEKWISCLKTLSKSLLLLQLVESASKPEKLVAIRLDAIMGSAFFCFVFVRDGILSVADYNSTRVGVVVVVVVVVV